MRDIVHDLHMNNKYAFNISKTYSRQIWLSHENTDLIMKYKQVTYAYNTLLPTQAF